MNALIVHVMQPVLSVSTSEQLAHGLQLLAASDFLALDTEFMRDDTYYPVLCLIQAADTRHCMVIDPLATNASGERLDLAPLWHFLSDRSRLKVLHAARQDLEVLSQAMSRSMQFPDQPITGPVFDTQVAAGLLGHPAQVGYGQLVTQRLQHTLPKGHARTDWNKRPLSSEQLDYAADDVRYLVPLYQNLREALRSAGRQDWLDQEMQELEDPALYRTEPQEAWRRLKGLDRLNPAQRATAKLLARWREERAMQSNRPRGWILSDEALRDIAERLPTAQSLPRIRNLPPAVIRKRGEELLTLVAQGKERAASESTQPQPGRPEPEQLAKVTQLMSVVRAAAQQLNIASELLATRRDVERLVFSGRTGRLLNGWRREVIGERLIELTQS